MTFVKNNVMKLYSKQKFICTYGKVPLTSCTKQTVLPGTANNINITYFFFLLKVLQQYNALLFKNKITGFLILCILLKFVLNDISVNLYIYKLYYKTTHIYLFTFTEYFEIVDREMNKYTS